MDLLLFIDTQLRCCSLSANTSILLSHHNLSILQAGFSSSSSLMRNLISGLYVAKENISSTPYFFLGGGGYLIIIIFILLFITL